MFGDIYAPRALVTTAAYSASNLMTATTGRHSPAQNHEASGPVYRAVYPAHPTPRFAHQWMFQDPAANYDSTPIAPSNRPFGYNCCSSNSGLGYLMLRVCTYPRLSLVLAADLVEVVMSRLAGATACGAQRS